MNDRSDDREKDTVRPQASELCAFSDKYGPHVPALAVRIGWNEDGTRRIACIPVCPKTPDQNQENAR